MIRLFDAYGNKIEESQVINVAVYGATGDGTTNDTTAIQNALNDCTEGDVLYFPYGTYLISSALLIKTSNIRIDLNNSTIKHNNTAFNCMMRNYADSTSGYTGISDVVVENGTFDANEYTGNLTQLGFIHGNRITVRNCRFIGTNQQNGTWHCIEYNAIKYGVIDNCYFEGNRGLSFEFIQLGDAYGSLGWPWDNPTFDDVGCMITEIKSCHFVDNGYATCVGWHGTTKPTYTNVHDCTGENVAEIIGSNISAESSQSHNNVSITVS